MKLVTDVELFLSKIELNQALSNALFKSLEPGLGAP